MKEMLYVLLGFLLSITSIIVTDLIRNQIKAKKVWCSLVSELRELRFMMASIAFNMKSHQGAMTKGFMDWFQPIVKEQAEAGTNIPEFPEELQKISEEGWEQLSDYLKRSTCVTVNEASLPFLDSLAAEVALLPVRKQRDLWRVKFQLDLYNQQIPFLHSQFEKTFDESLSDVNRERIQTNLKQGYGRLGERAKVIADIISLAIG